MVSYPFYKWLVLLKLPLNLNFQCFCFLYFAKALLVGMQLLNNEQTRIQLSFYMNGLAMRFSSYVLMFLLSN